MSRQSRRFYRSVLLGVAALGALLWAAHDQFDIPIEEIARLAMGAALVILLVIAAAGVALTLLVACRALWRRIRG